MRTIIFWSLVVLLYDITIPCMASAPASTLPTLTKREAKREAIRQLKQEIKRIKKERKFRINLYWGYYIVFFILFALGGGLVFTLFWTLFKGTWFTWFLIGGILGALAGLYWMIRGGLGF